MSVRVYTGPRRDRRRRPRSGLMAVPWVFAALTVAGQIAWVVASGPARDALTAGTVGTFFLASATHAAVSRGLPWAAGYLVITLGIGLGVEVLGTRTGWPFGSYAYGSGLGWSVFGVPLVVPLAWAMMAYPSLLAARRLSLSPVLVPLIGGWLLAAWDLFLDPQMVGQGYWTWAAGGLELPGVPGIPAQNFLGWLVTALVMMALLDRLPRRRADDGVPMLLLAWTYLGSIVANVAFLGRPGVALWGGLAMGAVMLPWGWRVWTSRP